MTLRLAVFANFEDPRGQSARTLQEGMATLCAAETLGFDEVWLTEHHFNRYSVSASIFPLLAHLAGRTQRVRLGAAAVLLPFHDPIRVAEDAATVDALSGGRLMLGVGRGGPFPEQFRHFGVTPEDSRARLLDALGVVERLLAGENVEHASPWLRLDGVATWPRPLQQPVPVWLASLAPDAVALAAARGYGLMGPSAMPLEPLLAAMDRQRAATPAGAAAAPPFVLARYFLCDRHHERARAEALPFIRDFGRRMGAQQRPLGPTAPSPAQALVGDPSAVAEQVQALQRALGDRPCTLLLKPATDDPARARAALRLFVDEVRPRLE